jgi:hypothetical protein
VNYNFLIARSIIKWKESRRKKRNSQFIWWRDFEENLKEKDWFYGYILIGCFKCVRRHFLELKLARAG